MVTMTKERLELGAKYQTIGMQLASIEMLPRALWSRKTKERVVDLLEQESEMDVKLSEYLINDGDAIGIAMLRRNQDLNANVLWDLKQELAAV